MRLYTQKNSVIAFAQCLAGSPTNCDLFRNECNNSNQLQRHPILALFSPRLKKLVLIAGPFNGVLGLGDLPNINRITPNGRPAFMSPTYFRIFVNRNNISDDLRVLNIYGNVVDHSNSDKYISVTSAKSISYILKPRVKEYTEYLIKGSNAEHSMLHDDSEILDMVNGFIYYNPLS